MRLGQICHIKAQIHIGRCLAAVEGIAIGVVITPAGSIRPRGSQLAFDSLYKILTHKRYVVLEKANDGWPYRES